MLTREPRPVRIGPYLYSAQLVPAKKLREKDGSFKEGETDLRRLRIWVRDNMAPRRQRETFFHELMHCAWDFAGVIPSLTPEHTEEGTIRPLCTSVYDILLEPENVWVHKYLFGEVDE